jgi:LPS export ABC transporter protein LptC
MISRERLRYVLISVVIVFCSVLIVRVVFYDRAPTPADVIEGIVVEADVALREFSYTETEAGVAQWTLNADSAEHDFSEDVTIMKNVRLDVFNQGEAGDVHLTAKTGRANLSTRDVTVRGSVIITTGNGYQFESESVTFHGQASDDGVVVSDESVRITSQQLDISGRGLEIDLAHGTFLIKEDVTAVYLPQPVKREQ